MHIFSLKIVILASRRVYCTRSNPDPQPAAIVDNLDKIGKKNKQVEDLGNKVSSVRSNSLPKKISEYTIHRLCLKF